jgi:hypothetical protein
VSARGAGKGKAVPAARFLFSPDGLPDEVLEMLERVRPVGWFSLKSVAKLMDVPLSTVRHWRRCGALKVELKCGKLRVSERALRELPAHLPVTAETFAEAMDRRAAAKHGSGKAGSERLEPLVGVGLAPVVSADQGAHGAVPAPRPAFSFSQNPNSGVSGTDSDTDAVEEGSR